MWLYFLSPLLEHIFTEPGTIIESLSLLLIEVILFNFFFFTGSPASFDTVGHSLHSLFFTIRSLLVTTSLSVVSHYPFQIFLTFQFLYTSFWLFILFDIWKLSIETIRRRTGHQPHPVVRMHSVGNIPKPCRSLSLLLPPRPNCHPLLPVQLQ